MTDYDLARTDSGGEDRELKLAMIRRDLAMLTMWRTTGPLGPNDAATYRSLCDSELRLLNS
jgi:hypothetical protein